MDKKCVICGKPIKRGFYCSDFCHQKKKEMNGQVVLRQLDEWMRKGFGGLMVGGKRKST